MGLGQKRPHSDILHLTFNQDALCFCSGLTSGFRVFTCEPFGESYRREFDHGGIGHVEMLFRSNILALVGGGPYPKFPPNKVMIWEDHQGRCIGEIPFRTPVRAVHMRKDRIAIALEHKVFVYTLADLKMVYQEETAANPDGLLALSPSPDVAVLVCLGRNMGQVRVEWLDTRRSKLINAHNSALQALSLSTSGKVLATGSEKGTIIRVFSTIDGTVLRELRRGTDPARIYSIAMSKGDRPEWLAVTSDKGTAHIFNIDTSTGTGITRSNSSGASGSSTGGSYPGGGLGATREGRGNSGELPMGVSPSRSPSGHAMATLSAIGRKLPVGGGYFNSERSFAQHRLPDSHYAIVAFGKEAHTILIVTATGAFHKLRFDPEKGGACEQLVYKQWKVANEEEEQGVPSWD